MTSRESVIPRRSLGRRRARIGIGSGGFPHRKPQSLQRRSEGHPRFDRFVTCFLTGDRFTATFFLGADFFAGLTSGVAMPVFTASLPRAVPIAVAAVFRNGSSASKTFLVGRITLS